jgi:hypothetical protein
MRKIANAARVLWQERAGWGINLGVAKWAIRKRSALLAGTADTRRFQRRGASFSGGNP